MSKARRLRQGVTVGGSDAFHVLVNHVSRYPFTVLSLSCLSLQSCLSTVLVMLRVQNSANFKVRCSAFRCSHKYNDTFSLTDVQAVLVSSFRIFIGASYQSGGSYNCSLLSLRFGQQSGSILTDAGDVGWHSPQRPTNTNGSSSDMNSPKLTTAHIDVDL